MAEDQQTFKTISYTLKGWFSVKKTFRTPQKTPRVVKNRYEVLTGVNAYFPMPEPLQGSPTPAPRAMKARFAQDTMQKKLHFQPGLPIITEAPQTLQQALPETQLQREMHLDNLGDDFRDWAAEMDVEDAQNPPTSQAGGLGSSGTPLQHSKLKKKTHKRKWRSQNQSGIALRMSLTSLLLGNKGSRT